MYQWCRFQCDLQFFDSLLSPFHIRCEQLADLMLDRLGVLPEATSDEFGGLQVSTP